MASRQTPLDDDPWTLHGYPYVLAKIFEGSEEFAEIRRTDPQKASCFWMPGRMAALDTEGIVAGLSRFGVDGRPESVRALAGDRTSAWSIARVWYAEIEARNVHLSRYDEDFVGLAACELWKRYLPECPSFEMLDDWMQEGYRLADAHLHAAACDRWQQIWEVIEPRLRPEMRSCNDAAVVFDGTQCLFNWLQVAMELLNASRHEPAYAQTGVQLCERVLSQFVGENDDFRDNFQADLGDLLFLAGRWADGERVLTDIIDRDPDHALGYVRLADVLGCGVRPDDGPIDRDRAVALLERALSRPVHDAETFDIEARLADMRQLSGDPK
ncbi:MAG: hypothetical protein HY699_05750 [Deltaproteobacteria bacterium]|nr:hypothetical protein [Deltaproteobacteria bacterium]